MLHCLGKTEPIMNGNRFFFLLVNVAKLIIPTTFCLDFLFFFVEEKQIFFEDAECFFCEEKES